MTTSTRNWESKRTQETCDIEKLLRDSFEQADSYRYNSASIRVRVIDSRFEGMTREERDQLVEKQLDKLPPQTQSDIVTLLTFAPSDLTDTSKSYREFLLNTEFEDPSPSSL